MANTVLEAVPNISEGRNPGVIRAIVSEIESVPGVEVVDHSSDPDHHRSVITLLGAPDAVADAGVRAAAAAAERIDLGRHSGVHPRTGSLDVLPFVPLFGASMEDAVEIARFVGRRIADELQIPVYFYAAASDPPGRTLAEIRRSVPAPGAAGGGLAPDLQPRGLGTALHPTAGAVCIGARPPLLAWNVYLELGADASVARAIAAEIREDGGGFPGLRALGLELPSQERVQVSMNLERPEATSAAEIYRAIERIAARFGARAAETEIIGLIPDGAASSAAAAFWRLRGGGGPERLLGRRVLDHLARAGPVTDG